MKIISEESRARTISKDFTIELDNGKQIIVSKSYDENDYGCENDWDIINGNKIYSELSEDEQDKVSDFINNLKL